MNIKIDETIWKRLPDDPQQNIKQWDDGNGVRLVFHSIGFDEALYSRLYDEVVVREYYRDSFAEQGAGIVQCDLVNVCGRKVVKVIGKKIDQGQPALYMGSIAIPLPDCSYVLSLYSRENGITGVRDTLVFSKLLSERDDLIPDPDSETVIGWTQDPYFPNYNGPCLRNLSELEEYDIQFPDHPLTKVRGRMEELVDRIELSIDMVQKNKPWWKIW